MLWANGIQQIRIHGIIVYIYTIHIKSFEYSYLTSLGHLQRCRQARDALSSLLLGYITFRSHLCSDLARGRVVA
ncbi:hypothetical protein PSENEW3_00004565 [Picochlorum sp. SENEW3]|nr:hypothetical protein PSENEW3_00004565 [Picochlorum sp. SENEW3]